MMMRRIWCLRGCSEQRIHRIKIYRENLKISGVYMVSLFELYIWCLFVCVWQSTLIYLKRTKRKSSELSQKKVSNEYRKRVRERESLEDKSIWQQRNTTPSAKLKLFVHCRILKNFKKKKDEKLCLESLSSSSSSWLNGEKMFF